MFGAILENPSDLNEMKKQKQNINKQTNIYTCVAKLMVAYGSKLVFM